LSSWAPYAALKRRSSRNPQRLKPGGLGETFAARLEVVPFPFVLASGNIVASANDVNGSGQECPLHMDVVSRFGNRFHVVAAILLPSLFHCHRIET
jgi:hypothetical protein